jgi:hypothetical protein
VNSALEPRPGLSSRSIENLERWRASRPRRDALRNAPRPRRLAVPIPITRATGKRGVTDSGHAERTFC